MLSRKQANPRNNPDFFIFYLNSRIKTKHKLLQVIFGDTEKCLNRRESEEIDTLLTTFCNVGLYKSKLCVVYKLN